MPPARGPDGRFKPNTKPKPRKKKTAQQKAEIVKRQKAEDARQDDVALERKRQFELYTDPSKFLAGFNPGLRGAIEATYRGQKAYYEEQPGGSIGPTYSPGSPPTSPRVEPKPTPQFPPGVRIKGKNLGKAERAHNRALKGKSTFIPEPIFPEPAINTTSVAKSNLFGGTLPSYSSDYMYVPGGDASGFAPVDEPEGNYDTDYVAGDYVEAILGLQPGGTDEDPAPAQPNPYLDIIRNQPAQQPDANVFREEGEKQVVKLTDEERKALATEAKGLSKQIKMAKTPEEKAYYKQALEDLKEGDTAKRRSRRKQAEDRAIQSAPASFIPQQPGIKKYPGPANIVNGFPVASTEVSSRPLNEYEEQQYMGKGTTGRTERYTSDVYADAVGEYKPPEPPPEQSAQELRQRLKRIPVEEGFNYSNQLTEEQVDDYMGINEDLLPRRITEEDFTRDYEVVDYSESQRRKAEAKGKSYPTMPQVKKILQENPVSMINKTRKVVSEETEYDYTRKSGAPTNPVPFKKSMDPMIRGGVSFTATGAPEIQYSGKIPPAGKGTKEKGPKGAKQMPFKLGRKSQTQTISYKSGDKVRNPDKTKVGGKRIKDVFQYNTGASNQQIRYYGIKR